MADKIQDKTKARKQPVNWRNVAILVAFGSPVWYVATLIPPPKGAPRVTSPEAWRIIRDWATISAHNLTSLSGGPNKGLK